MEIKSSIHNYIVTFDSIKNLNRDNSVLIVDSFFKDKFKQLENIIFIESHESKKEYSYISQIIDQLIQNGFKKNHTLVAIGGGVIQDITGFISSILYRGVKWVFYPTTLLSQGDSCIGGKTSINFGKYKNQLGNFYPPNKIIIDVDFLNTLPELEIYSGIGEMSHYFFIDGLESYNFYKNYNFNGGYLSMIKKSLQIKKKMIELDEFDTGSRRVFNYGHSFGHAIESITNYDMPHGIAISHGMDMSNFISYKLGYISFDDYNDMKKIIDKITSKKPLPNINSDDMIAKLRKDKKNVGDNLGLILTKGLGKMFLSQNNPNKIKDILVNYLKGEK